MSIPLPPPPRTPQPGDAPSAKLCSEDDDGAEPQQLKVWTARRHRGRSEPLLCKPVRLGAIGYQHNITQLILIDMQVLKSKETYIEQPAIQIKQGKCNHFLYPPPTQGFPNCDPY